MWRVPESGEPVSERLDVKPNEAELPETERDGGAQGPGVGEPCDKGNEFWAHNAHSMVILAGTTLVHSGKLLRE